MALYPPAFDELWVISDIHMGGYDADFQIFNRGDRLAKLIDHITALPDDIEAALVLNGDIVDSLAEEQFVAGYVALDAVTAVRMMEHIYSDKAFAPVWQAFGRLVRTPRRHLVFVLGNHDIELALPVVEDSIRQYLSKSENGDANEPARARIHFSTHGGGFACRVGAARVFCTHGNELDDWNLVDYNRLGQLANAINAGRSVPRAEWRPNAGTRLVVDVMNIVKKEHPFVDLLKPEASAVASVLLAMDKETFKKVDLSDAFPLIRDKYKGSKITGDLLGPDVELSSDEMTDIATTVAEQLLGEQFSEAVLEHQDIDSEEALLLGAGVAAAAGKSATDFTSEDKGTLGVGSYIDLFAGWIGLVPRSKALRLALADWISNDTSFAVSCIEKDELYEGMLGIGEKNKMRIAEDVDFLVTGHTHLARAKEFSQGRFYFNCGTWIRLLQLTKESVESQEVFDKKVWPLLRGGKLSDLDEAYIPGRKGKDVRLVLDRTNAVRINCEGNKTKGELLRIADPGGRLVISPEKDNTDTELEPFLVS